MGLFINGLGAVAFRPMFCSRSLPRSKKNKIVFTGEYDHVKPDKRLGEAAQAGYIDWNHPNFNPLINFIKSL